jgi:hypothetical protein
MRLTPWRVKTADAVADSPGPPGSSREPSPEYSPSEFSRTHTMSSSAGPRPASGQATPGSSRIGRRLTYCSKRCRMGRISSHTDTWSGTDGAPTAPK